MDYRVEPIIINTDDIQMEINDGNLYERRKAVGESHFLRDTPEASIIVTGYNRLEKTKRCIESIIEHTTDVDYELILLDNGSEDGTYEFFQSVPVAKKIIMQVTKNLGAGFANSDIIKIFKGKYFVSIPNDIVVTKNWLSNILKCYNSDDRIGLAVPISTNISNRQQPIGTFDTLQQVFNFGVRNNISNPLRWSERVRVVTPIVVQRRDVMDLVGCFDYGFFHDFAEDDYCIRIRRAGYKVMLCEDSFVHHDHDFRNMEDKDPEQYRKTLEKGRRDYQDKYHGLDAWDDVNNYEPNLISMLKHPFNSKQTPNLLGVDVRMGTPVLEIRNELRKKGVLNTNSYAFTTQAKHFADLQTICGENVHCDRVDFIFEHFTQNMFDYIVVGEPINSYAQPVKLMQRLIEFAKPGGQIIFKIKNQNNISRFAEILGGDKFIDDSMFVNVDPGELIECAKLIGISSYDLVPEVMDVDAGTEKALKQIVSSAKLSKDVVDTTKKLGVENYLIRLCK